MLTVDMVPDDPGIWLFHCHVSEHMEDGMMARYEVLKK
jgi:hephaestin